jgi:hypothetical protein
MSARIELKKVYDNICGRLISTFAPELMIVFHRKRRGISVQILRIMVGRE